MKTIATLIFVLFLGVAAQAQNATEEVKIAPVEMSTVVENVEVTLEKTTEVARLYKFKNARIKKALSFTTKKNKAKIA